MALPNNKRTKSPVLPKFPKKGEVVRIKNPKTGRETCFKATGKQGFGKWKIVSCKGACKASNMAEKNPRVQSGDVWIPGVGWH